MIKKVTKVGNSQGVLFDATIMELAHLKLGDSLNLEIHAGGTITLTPIRATPSPEDISAIIKGVMKDYAGTMKRLA